MKDYVAIPVFHLNVLLSVSNAWAIYSVYYVFASSELSYVWKYGLVPVLIGQSIASATQHITERHCTPHRMYGIVCTRDKERTMLWADRAMAGVVSIMYIGLIWSHVGITIFMCSWYALYLAWCLGLIYICDNHIHDSPLLYTSVHLVWHISIYSFLGDVVQWIE